MKLHNDNNDSFIVTSNDVLVNGKNSSILTDIIDSQEDKLNELEKNVKWLYKYGGTGSKGSGGSTKFSVDATILFGSSYIKKVKDNQKIILSDNNKQSETLSISINNGTAINNYIAKIYNGTNNLGSFSLNTDNDYTISLNISLGDSGTIRIQLNGTSGITGDPDNFTYIFTYIKNPYKISLSLVDKNNNKINNDLYVNDAQEGVNLNIDYDIISSKQIAYELVCEKTMLNSPYPEYINDSEHGVGIGNLKIPFNQDFINNPDNYGSHNITAKFYIEPDDSIGILNGQVISQTLSFTYIPFDRIFFKIEPLNSNAKIYKYSLDNYNNAINKFDLYRRYYDCYTVLDNEQTLDTELRSQIVNELVEESLRPTITDQQLKDVISNKLSEIESELYIFNKGSLQLYIQAYNGSNALGDTDVLYNLELEHEENTTDVELLNSLQYRTRQFISIPIHKEGVYKLCIKSSTQNPSHYIYYYFAVIDKNSGINWFSADVDFNNVDLYYNQGKIGTHITNNSNYPGYLDYIRQYEGVQKIQKYSNGDTSELFNINNIVESSAMQSTTCDIMLSFGIQYSYINDDSKKIMSILTNNSSSPLNIDIYQNMITSKDNSDSKNTLANIFIPKEHNYSPSVDDKYHLLTLYKRYIYETESPYYEIIVYIDGCPEAAFKNFVKDYSFWTNVILNNTNFSINFFEIAFFKHDKTSSVRFIKTDANIVEQYPLTYLDDIAISEYYYKYISSRQSLSNIISLLNNLRNFKETEYGMIEVASKSDIDAIAKEIKIPVLMFEYTEQNDNEFVNWFTASYDEKSLSETEFKLSNLYYSPGSNTLTQINLPTVLGESYWYIKLQGSSTGKFFDKNLTLGINNKTEGYMGIFTPNFYNVDLNTFITNTNDDKEKIENAKKTFLPETAFTLKADVVDSSHSNNTAVGSFVNANTTQFDILFDSGTTNKGNNKYVHYIKNCLLGFPVLGFIKVNRGSKESFYFLGIYNFNLGRDSYFNMGYYSPQVLNDEQNQPQVNAALENGDGKNFIVTYIKLTNGTSLPIDNGVIVAEIQGGKEYFDFSQYHQSMLLPQQVSEGKDSGYMFDDFVPRYNPAKTSNTDYRIEYHLGRLVESVAKAGGYLFDNVLQKHLGEYKYSYNKYIDKGYGSSIFDSANQVPNYKIQYRRAAQENDKELQYLIYNFKKDNNGNIILINGQPSIDETYFADDVAVHRLIATKFEEGSDDQYGNGNKPILDYKSLTEYYVTCMGFGLVDSVMKNLNVKSWDATYTNNPIIDHKTGKWYVAFYDMDTSFGRDNGGGKTSYFAFSDYWKTNKSSDLEPPTIYRDFYPVKDTSNEFVSGQELTESGFDIPSSYLFAVAKYAHLLNDVVPKNYIPHNIWARWRYNGTLSNTTNINGPGMGELKNANYFIDKYFIRNLDQIPEQLWALNYRLKYLKRITNDPTNKYTYTYDKSENGMFENTNFIPFHGKGINELREWLNGRFHILDSYFNLEGNNTLNIKYLKYVTDNEIQQFTPIIRFGDTVGYAYHDNQVPDKDNEGNYKWLTSRYVEKVPDIEASALSSNDDIEILKDIFSTDGQGGRYSQPIDLYIKAQDFSPFNIHTALDEIYKYLLEDSSTKYHVTYRPKGLQITKFGGSSLWTYIENLNTIINQGTLTLNTENLDQIVLTQGICDSWNISKMKSLKTINITKELYDTDTKFSGTMSFIKSGTDEDPFPDLTSITLIRTEITLTVNGEGVSNINLSYTQSGITNIINCNNLQSVILNGFTATSLNITPGWSNDMLIESTNINEIKLTPKDKTAETRKVKINNDNVVTSVILDGFTHITLSNCTNLYNICIKNPTDIVSLEIVNCNTNIKDKHNLNIYFTESNVTSNGQTVIPENNSDTVSLKSLTNIKSFKFNGTLGFKIIDVSENTGEEITINGNTYNCIRLYSNAFSNTSLTNIITAPNVWLYIDSDNVQGTTETFANCEYGLQTNKMIIGSNVRKLDSFFRHDMFGIYTSSPQIQTNYVKSFLEGDSNVVIYENIDNIISLNSMFYGQTYVANSSNNHTFDLSSFKNVFDISYMFFGTSMTSFVHTMFGPNDSSYCGMNVVNNHNEFKLNNFIPTTCSVDKNIFKYYINNVKILLSDAENISYNLNILGYSSSDTFKITDLFNGLDPDNNMIDTLLSLNIDKELQVDWSDLMYDSVNNKVKFPHLRILVNSFSSDNINNTNYNKLGLNKINISELEYFKNSFNYSPKSVNKIQIDTIINYDQLSFVGDNAKALPWHETVNSLNGAKQISSTKIIALLKKLNEKGCTSLNHLFENTTIIIPNNTIDKNSLVLSEKNSKYINFKSCSYLFSNAKLVDEDNNIYGFEITNKTLKAFTYVSNWSYAFYNCTLHKNLPLNMFNLKGEGDYDDWQNYTQRIDNLSSMFENVKLDSNESWFNYTWTPEDITKYNKGIELNGSYNQYVKTRQGATISNYPSKDKVINNGDYVYGSNIKHNLILPWDIFYACKSTCNISSFIKNSEFEGLLPANLFPIGSPMKSLMINDAFYNTLVIPNYWNDILIEYYIGNETLYTVVPAYVFVPEQFTQCTSLINAFNFKLLLPNSPSLDEYTTVGENIINNPVNNKLEAYFLLFNSSVKFGELSSIRDFLPVDIERYIYDEGSLSTKRYSLHDIDDSIQQNQGVDDLSFNARKDYGIHYYMYLNNNIESLSEDHPLYHINEQSYPLVKRYTIDPETNNSVWTGTYYAFSRTSTDTGLPAGANMKLLYEQIFNNDIMAFCYGNILGFGVNLGNLQPIGNSSPLICIDSNWGNFCKNIILPLNNNNGQIYYKNTFRTSIYEKNLSLSNIYNNDNTSLTNYTSNKFINEE